MEHEALEQMLQDALAHLHDPSYVPPDRLWNALAAPSERSHQSFQTRLVFAIRTMQPPAQTPSTARARRYYELLDYRYIQELTQKEAARRLQISPRHLRREQQQAVQALANRLSEMEEPPRTTQSGVDEQERPDSWLENLQQEVAALREVNPNIRSRVKHDMSRAVKLMEAILASQDIAISLCCRDDLEADVHPSVLRQVLIAAIEDLARRMDKGVLTLDARSRGDSVEISVIGEPVSYRGDDRRTSDWNVLAAQTGAGEFRQDGTRAIITLRVPAVRNAVGDVSVLVIDDNDDIVHVFKRYALGTQYQVQQLATFSEDVLRQVAELRPDIIVLDVLMPNLDGWELLGGLRQHPLTGRIPVIICSVIRREELAHTLGASAHLSKPVRSQQFLDTLDRVWQAAAAA